MKDLSGSPPIIRFGVFEVDLRAGELRKQGLKIKLQEQPFQVLAMLLERAGEVVTREELHERVWGSDTFVDIEHGLATAVKKIREALGDDAETPRYIETLPRRGYRFIYPVEPLTPSPSPTGRGWPAGPGEGAVAPVSPPAKPVAAVYDRRPEAAARRAALQKRLALVAGFTVAVVAALLVFNIAGLRDRVWPKPAPPKIQSIAVLPLENLSGDPEQEFFAEGMTEALITELGKVRALRVISRHSVMRYKGKDKTIPEIARELNVDAVVEGSVRRVGDRVRISAQLVNANPEQHLWAENFERNVSDILALESEMAQAIAREIRVTATPGQTPLLATRRTVNPAAHEAYLRGRFFWAKGVASYSREFMNISRRYLEQAIAIDPEFAPAHAWLAGCYVNLSHEPGYLPHEEGIRKSRSQLAKAQELDRNLAEVHSWLGFLKSYEERDWQGARREFERALELDPNDSFNWLNHAFYLLLMGRSEEAVLETKRALQLDPVSEKINRSVADLLYFARRYDEAIDAYRKLREINPASMWAGGMAHAYAMKGMSAEAINAGKEAVRIAPSDPGALCSLGLAYALAGRRDEAHEILRELKKSESSPAAIAGVYAALDEKEQAISWLERAVVKPGDILHSATLRVEPVFDNLRDHPRFQDLLRRMNFPP